MDINLIDENILFVILIIIVDFYLGCWVYFSDKKSVANRQFFGLTLLLSLWAIFCYEKSILSADISIVLVKSAYAIVSLFFTLFYFFLNNFPKKEKSKWILDCIILCMGTFLVLFSFSDNMVKSIISISGKNVPVLGDGRFIFLGLMSALILFITAEFFRKYSRFSKAEKLKAEYFFIGFVVFIAINFVFNIVIPIVQGNAQYSCLGNHSAIFFLVLTAYAIVRRELMDIDLLFTQILVGIISVILFLDVMFLSNNLVMQAVKIGTLLIFLYFGRKLVKSVRKEIEAKEKLQKSNLILTQRNNDLRVLLDVGNTVSQNLDSRKISQDIVDSIPQNLKYLGYTFGVIVLCSEEKDCAYVYAVTDSPLARKIESSAKVQFGKFREQLSANNDLIVRTIKNKKIYTGDNMEYFFGGFMDEKKNRDVQRVLDAKSFISIPLFSSGQVMGAIVLSNEKSLNNMTERGKEIVGVFASHIGPSIENAQLYEKTDSQMKELSKLNSDLQKANVKLKELLEMKNEFLHITSHQLRTPLTAVRGMISMWIDGDFDKMSKEKKGEMLSRIYASAERLNNITNDMLDALELEGGVAEMKFQKASVVKMINDTVNMLKPEFDKKGLYLKVNEIQGKTPEAEVDLNYMGQVFTNLIENAYKYTPKGGVEIGIKTGSKNINITISDTGIGIGHEDKEKIFDKFTRGKNAMAENISGSGLGLFVVKKILDEHNGKIEMKSAGVGKGTTFEISLPIKQE